MIKLLRIIAVLMMMLSVVVLGCSADDWSVENEHLGEECSPAVFESYCSGNVAMICGNKEHPNQLLQYFCTGNEGCRVDNGQAGCGECTPGEGAVCDGDSHLKYCNEAGVWDSMVCRHGCSSGECVKLVSSEGESCDPSSFKSVCESGDYMVECWATTKTKQASKCLGCSINKGEVTCLH